MKRLKLFEDLKYSLTVKTIDDFNDLIHKIKPVVLLKYYELADDDTYEPEWGYTPTNQYSKDDLVLLSADVLKNDDISFSPLDCLHTGQLLKFLLVLSHIVQFHL